MSYLRPARRTLLSSGAVAAAIVVAAAGCGQGPETSGGDFDPKNCNGGTLYVLNQRDSGEHLDPARLYTSGGGSVPSLLFRTLTTRNRVPGAAGAKVAPDLATDTGTASADAKTWTYHLRDGLRFEDGTPITSRDVKYGIERSFAPELSGGIPYLRDWLVGGASYQGPYKQPAGLRSIETPDDRTIVFHLRKPEADFPFVATATQFAPVPKAKDTGTDYERHPLSSGPYQIESYEKNKRMTLVRNPKWSRSVDNLRLACPDRVELTLGLNPSVINQRLSTGGGHDANAITTDTNLNPAELARASGDPALRARMARGNFGSTTYLAFDTTKKPFDDIRVRQAFAYAINRRSAVDAVGGSSLARPATTFLPDQPAYGYQPYDYFPAGETGDPAKAKQLLAQAGHAHGLSVTLTHTTERGEAQGPEVATAVQEALRQAGVRVQLAGLDVADFMDKAGKPATASPLALLTWGADWPSGGPFLGPIFDGRQILRDGGNFNYAQFDDPSVNAQIDAANKIVDPATAREHWGRLDAQLGRQALVVPLFHPVFLRLYGKNVKNAYVDEWRGTYDVAMVSVR